jgi:hypothetical protein
MALRVTLLVLDLLPIVATSLIYVKQYPLTLVDADRVFYGLPDGSNAILATGQD